MRIVRTQERAQYAPPSILHLRCYSSIFWEPPQMWVWPQLVFGGSPPYPIVIGGPFPPRQTPSLPTLSFQGAAQAVRGGRGPRAQGGGGGAGLQAALGARPTSGVTRRSYGRGAWILWSDNDAPVFMLCCGCVS